MLPALLVRALYVHEVEAVEGVLLLDASIQVHAAVAAGVALDGSALVDDGQLVAVRRHRDLVPGDDGDDGEESALRLPAFGAPARVVVDDRAAESDLDGVASAEAAEIALARPASSGAKPSSRMGCREGAMLKDSRVFLSNGVAGCRFLCRDAK